MLQPERVQLRFLNSGSRSLALVYRDLPPPSFQFELHSAAIRCKRNSITTTFYSVTPVCRGIWQWGDVHVQVFGPIGLSLRRKTFPQSFQVKIYPGFGERSPFAFSSQKRTYLAAKRYRTRGPGKEFESLRPYIVGDDPRSIDWKASARKGSIISRQYDVERNQTLFLLIDCGRLMTTRIGPVGKLDYVLDSAASLACLALDQGDFVGVIAFSNDIHLYMPPRKGIRQLRYLMERFLELQANAFEPDYQHTFALFRTLQKKRSLVAVFTDFLDLESSGNLIGSLQKIAEHHVPLCLTIENSEIEQILAQPADSPESAAQKAVAWNFKLESMKVRDLLKSYGILTLHANHNEFTRASVEKYIRIKINGMV